MPNTYSALLFGRNPATVVGTCAVVSKQRFDRIRTAALKRGLTMKRGWGRCHKTGRRHTFYTYADAAGYCFAHLTIQPGT